MSVSYASEYPDISVDPAVKAFFEKFYAISDTPDIHERYAQSFTPDATLIMASTKVSGYASELFCPYGPPEAELFNIHSSYP